MSVAFPAADKAGTQPRLLPWPLGRRWEAADFVVALVSGLVFAILAIFALLCVGGYGTTLASAQNRAQTAANIVASQMGWVAGSSLAALDLVDARLAMLPAELDVSDKADLEAALRALPAGSQLAIYDAQGDAVPNGGAPGLPGSIADTDYFTALAQGGNWTVLPQFADAATGAPLIVFVKALGTGAFAGVALLALDGGVLQSLFEPQNLGPDSTLILVRADGWMVGRYPAVEAPINIRESSPYWATISASEAGTYSARSQIDGINRIVGFRHLPSQGLIVFATLSQDAVMASLWNAIFTVLWLLVPLSAALVGGSLLTARLLRQGRRNEQTLAAAVAHNEVLFREIHHRVKNNLQSVASLLQMQPIPREIKANMGQRIAAMSAVHEHIYRSNNFATVDVKGYLTTLVESIRAGSDPHVEVTIGIESLLVDKDAATPLGLIVNEVVSNAFKHAFADGRHGQLRVTLERAEDGRGLLTVEDNGMGFDPGQPAKGIGRRLIAALTEQIGGVSGLASAPGGGSTFTLSFPAAA